MPARLPGDPVRKMQQYQCKECGFAEWSDKPTKCLHGHGPMLMIGETFKDRREAIRRASKEREK